MRRMTYNEAVILIVLQILFNIIFFCNFITDSASMSLAKFPYIFSLVYLYVYCRLYTMYGDLHRPLVLLQVLSCNDTRRQESTLWVDRIIRWFRSFRSALLLSLVAHHLPAPALCAAKCLLTSVHVYIFAVKLFPTQVAGTEEIRRGQCREGFWRRRRRSEKHPHLPNSAIKFTSMMMKFTSSFTCAVVDSGGCGLIRQAWSHKREVLRTLAFIKSSSESDSVFHRSDWNGIGPAQIQAAHEKFRLDFTVVAAGLVQSCNNCQTHPTQIRILPSVGWTDPQPGWGAQHDIGRRRSVRRSNDFRQPTNRRPRSLAQHHWREEIWRSWVNWVPSLFNSNSIKKPWIWWGVCEDPTDSMNYWALCA